MSTTLPYFLQEATPKFFDFRHQLHLKHSGFETEQYIENG